MRAIEIAKELHAGSSSGAAGITASSNSTAATTAKVVSVLDMAKDKHEEIVSRQHEGGTAPTSSPVHSSALEAEGSTDATVSKAEPRTAAAAVVAATLR